MNGTTSFLRAHSCIRAAVADAMDMARGAARGASSDDAREADRPGCHAWIPRGWLGGPTLRKIGTLSDLHFLVGLPGFEPGTS